MVQEVFEKKEKAESRRQKAGGRKQKAEGAGGGTFKCW
jgi:hypothetical protein